MHLNLKVTGFYMLGWVINGYITTLDGDLDGFLRLLGSIRARR